jgi:hypothetical protein
MGPPVRVPSTVRAQHSGRRPGRRLSGTKAYAYPASQLLSPGTVNGRTLIGHLTFPGIGRIVSGPIAVCSSRPALPTDAKGVPAYGTLRSGAICH